MPPEKTRWGRKNSRIYNGYRIRGVQRRVKAPILQGPAEIKGMGIREMPGAHSHRKSEALVAIRVSYSDKGTLAVETAFV